MPLFTTLIILTLLASVVICYTTVMMVFKYNKKYRFMESKYTRLFGIITKEHVTILYVLFVLAQIVVTLLFIITL